MVLFSFAKFWTWAFETSLFSFRLLDNYSNVVYLFASNWHYEIFYWIFGCGAFDFYLIQYRCNFLSKCWPKMSTSSLQIWLFGTHPHEKKQIQNLYKKYKIERGPLSKWARKQSKVLKKARQSGRDCDERETEKKWLFIELQNSILAHLKRTIFSVSSHKFNFQASWLYIAVYDYW